VALHTLLRRHTRYRPHATAIVFEGERISHAALNERVNRIANGLLDLGLGHGSEVAIILDNTVEVIEVYHAAAKTGMAVVPLSPLLRGAGLVNLINDADSTALITMTRLVPEIEAVRNQLDVDPERLILIDGEHPGYRSYHDLASAASPAEPSWVDVSDDDIFNIIYSSGTTGLPKGIVHTHRIRQAYATGFAASYRISRESVVLHSGSLVFNGAFLTLMPALYHGCTYVLMPGFESRQMIDLMASERVTHVMVVPSQIIALLGHDDFDESHLPGLEMICSVGAPLHLEHKEELARRLPNRFYELYGLTEGFVTVLDRDDFAAKPNSVGIPPPLYEMRIVDDDGNDLPPGEVGEIVGRGPITMPGYYKRPDLTADAIRNGWLHTGDLGYVDEDGFLFLVDRKKDLIISGGVNVYPRDIEDVVIQHPDVSDVAVFGAPDDKWGESPIAAVRLRDEASSTPEQVHQWVNERVAARFQKVREVIPLDEFPLSVAGKTLRRVIRDEYLES
jgi:acyl-CoA synthetase (AMP-forming)/AMP-acid ligase II